MSGGSLEFSKKLASFEEFLDFSRSSQEDDRRRSLVESALFSDESPFEVIGHCCVCQRRGALFSVDFGYAWEILDGRRMPNWREHLTCRSCGLNNRMRAVMKQLRQVSQPHSHIYVSEQVTPLFKAAKAFSRKAVGSEFL